MIFHSIQQLKELSSPLVIAIGVFDGVHLGHQVLIRRALEDARYCAGACLVLTFDPHPAQFLRPSHAPHLLTSTSHKIQLIQNLGAEHILILPFHAELAELSAEKFIQLLTQSAPKLHEICVGYNWKFGKGRKGNVALLRKLGKDFHFQVTEIGAIELDGKAVSSTRIRHAIQEKKFTSAAQCLGREYSILGTVVRGDARGHAIGFPTANLAAHNEVFPPNGVYVVRAQIGTTVYPGVANVGVRPTVSSSLQRILEVHLLNFSDDLYGKDIEVCFEAYLRPEKKFPSIPDLRCQIEKDIQNARTFLKIE